MKDSISILIMLISCATFADAQAHQESFLEPLDDDAYGAVLQFFQYDPSLPLQAEIVEQYDDSPEGFIREKIVFTSPSGDRVPSLLLLPVRVTRPYPIVFVMPGGNGRKEDIVDHESKYRAYTDALIERGVAVFSLDAAFHNERQSRRGFRESLMRHGLVNRWRDLVVDTVVDYRRAIDYLESRPELDTSRIGSVGGSMGGIFTLVLTAVEPRVQVSVANTALPWTPTSWAEFGWSDIPFQLPVVGTQHYASRIRTPFLMQMGRRDPFYSFEEGQELFRLVGTEKKEIIWYDSDHDLPHEETRRNALRWLDTYLIRAPKQ